MNESSSRPTLNSLQILRAIAAVLIVLAHMYPNLMAFGGDKNAIPNFIFGAIGVDIFFVLSGFIMVYTSDQLFGSTKASVQFFLRRLARVAPLYWIATSVILYNLYYLMHMPMDWGSVFASYAFFPYLRADGTTMPLLGVGWTLNYEMFFYLCFALALFFQRRLAVSLLTLLFCSLVTFRSFLPEVLNVWMIGIIYEFIFGAWLGLAFLEGIRIPRWSSYVLIPAAIALMLTTYLIDFQMNKRYAGWEIGATMIVAAVILVKSKPLSASKWKSLILLGDASYALYLFHAVLPHYLNMYITRFFAPADYPYSYVMVLLVASIIGALLIHLYLEKPLTNFLQKKLNRYFSAKIRQVDVNEGLLLSSTTRTH
jgi:exopolysaccharide production protein ExoZ